MSNRAYNVEGLIRFTAASAEMIPMFINGTQVELEDAIKKLYSVARAEFPDGPIQIRDALNSLISELDLPMIMKARCKDSGKIL